VTTKEFSQSSHSTTKKRGTGDKDTDRIGTYKDPCSKRLRRPSTCKRVESHLSSRMLCLPQVATVIRAFKNLTIEGHGGLEAWSMIRPLSVTCIGRQIGAAPLSKLLKLVFVHTSEAEARHLTEVQASPHKQTLSPFAAPCNKSRTVLPAPPRPPPLAAHRSTLLRVGCWEKNASEKEECRKEDKQCTL
jgi:hypothetical protein